MRDPASAYRISAGPAPEVKRWHPADLSQLRKITHSRETQDTARFAAGQRVRSLSGLQRQAELRLDRLEAATGLADLAALPGHRLEALTGDRDGQYSIGINDQWRICFACSEGSPGPVNVGIVDCH